MSKMLWRRRAERWDRVGAAQISKVIEAVLAECGRPAGAVAVDLGCGSGQVTLPLARRCAHVLAIDINAHAIAMLLARAERQRVTNIQAVASPAETLDLPPASVDLVVSDYALHHLRDVDKRRVIERSYKWLRPGGRLVIGDMMFGRGVHRTDREIIREKIRGLARRGPGGWWRIFKNAWRFLFRFQERPLTPAAWHAIVRGAGFANPKGVRVVAEACVISATKPTLRRMDAAAGRARRRRHRRSVGLVSAAAIAFASGLGFAAIAYPDDPPAVVPAGAIGVKIAGTRSGPAIPAGFVGLSLEYPTSLAYSGLNPKALNGTFIRLVRALNPNQSPVIRIGGDTTDWTWWPTIGVAKPPGVRYALTRRWLAVTRAMARALGARLILGINLEGDSPRVAGTEARALLGGLGRHLIAGFELGNEPEVYGKIGWYTNAAGVGVPGRPPTYDFRSYLADYAAISAALPRVVPLIGPASGSPAWPSVRQFLAANRRVRIVTFHVYPLRRCHTPITSPQYPTIAHLLTPNASAAAAMSLQPAIAAAHARGVPLRVDELNSVSCKGARGVSDTFASALWVLDSLFQLARVGVAGVNIHTLSDVPYEPFAFTHSRGRWLAEVKPMYYGLLLFTRAAPPGSRLLATFHAPNPALDSWATLSPGRTVRMVLINTSRTHTLTLSVRPPGAVRSAALERLLAPGLGATSGVTLAGQTFSASTATGTLSGTLRITNLRGDPASLRRSTPTDERRAAHAPGAMRIGDGRPIHQACFHSRRGGDRRSHVGPRAEIEDRSCQASR